MHVLNTNDELDIKVVYNACTRTENKIPCLPILVKHRDMLISFFFTDIVLLGYLVTCTIARPSYI